MPMSFVMRTILKAALVGVVATVAHGCGQGLFDRGSLAGDAGTKYDPDGNVTPPPDDAGGGPPDAVKPPEDSKVVEDAGKQPTDDAGRPEDALNPQNDDGPKAPSQDVGTQLIDQTSKTFTVDGGTLSLGPATLTVAPGTFRTPTQMTMRELAGIDHSGAYGPVFEISAPSGTTFSLDVGFTLSAPNVGDFQPNLELGMLNPTLPLADQQWFPPQYSKLSDDQKTLTGPLTEFQKTNILDVGAVLKCGTKSDCPPRQACNSGACQQCPTLTSCS
jgi:hypothetical protein